MAQQQGTVSLSRRDNESVFDLNNRASRAAQDGNYDGAVGMYLQSLASLDYISVRPRVTSRGAVRSSASVSYVSDEEEEAGDDQHDIVPQLILLSVPISSSSLQVSATSSNGPHHFALYDQLLVTTSREQNQITQNRNNKILVNAMIRFNLGVCLQVKEGTRHEAEQRTNLLRDAEQSYINALRALDEHRDGGAVEDALLLKLALYNNIGLVYQRLADTQAAGRCSAQIQILLGQRRRAQFPMNVRDWNFFVSTSLLRQQAQEAAPSLVVPELSTKQK